MTDTSTASDDFKLGPFPRPLTVPYRKTIIIITGRGNIGKSTLSKVMLNDSISYIGTDAASMQTDHGIPEVLKYLNDHINDKPEIDLGRFAHFIMAAGAIRFIDYFFDRFIANNKKMNIIVEGYLFTIPEAYVLFMNKCKRNGYRVWKMSRIC